MFLSVPLKAQSPDVARVLPKAISLKKDGNTSVKQRQYREAIAYYKSARALFDGCDIRDNKEVSDLLIACHNNTALCHDNLEEYDTALQACYAVVAMDNENCKAIYRAAKVSYDLYLKRGRLEMLVPAVLNANQALKLTPDDEAVRALQQKIMEKSAAVSCDQLRNLQRFKESEDFDIIAIDAITDCVQRLDFPNAKRALDLSQQRLNFKEYGDLLISIAIAHKAAKLLEKVLQHVDDKPLPKPLEKLPERFQTSLYSGVMLKSPFLFQAAVVDDLDIFKQLMQAGYSLTEIGVAGVSLVFRAEFKSNLVGAAAFHGSLDILREVMLRVDRKEIEVQVPEIGGSPTNEYAGFTPLNLAMYNLKPKKVFDIVKCLIDNGAKTDHIPTCKVSIFHCITALPIKQRKEVLQYLLKHTSSISVLTHQNPILKDPAGNLRIQGDPECAQMIENRIKELKEKPKAKKLNPKPNIQTPITKSSTHQPQVTQAHKSTTTSQMTTIDKACQTEDVSVTSSNENYKQLYEAKLKEFKKLEWQKELDQAKFDAERAELKETNLNLELAASLAEQEKRKVEKILTKTRKKLDKARSSQN